MFTKLQEIADVLRNSGKLLAFSQLGEITRMFTTLDVLTNN